MKRLAVGLTVGLLALGLLSQSGPATAKLARIAGYENSPGPYQNVTLTADEVNRYLADDKSVKLPAGVSEIKLDAQPRLLLGTATVNFDQLAASRPRDLLLAMISGTHRIGVQAQVDSAAAPAAQLVVTQVTFDGQVMPNVLMDAVIAGFVKPRYPKLGRKFEVPLPRHCAGVQVGEHEVTLLYPSPR